VTLTIEALRGLPPRELLAACARIAVRLKLNYNEDLHALLSLFREDQRFRASEIRDQWAEFASSGAPARAGVGLYLHVPYCESLCSFCFCSTFALDHDDKLESYTRSIEREIEYFAPVMEKSAFRSFHVGGGSPSILTAKQLERALLPCSRRFRFEPDSLRSIECNPLSTNLEKLRVMREAGFNRVSFGVQSLNPAVLAKIRRGYQTREMVTAAVADAKRAGFEEINLDFLLGLVGEERDSFLETARGVVALGPDTFTVCGVSLTEGYLRENHLEIEQYESRYDSVVEGSLPELREVAEAGGYRCNRLQPESGAWIFVSDRFPRPVMERLMRGSSIAHRPQAVLGLGPFSQSKLPGRLWYQRTRDSHLGFDEAEPIYVGRRVDAKQEMMRHLVNSMQVGAEISRGVFQSRFGTDVTRAFAEELAALETLGQARVEEERIVFLSPSGPSRFLHAMIFLRDLLPELDERRSVPMRDGAAVEPVKRLRAGEGIS
jgi:oxygen-independent coproporphyrinogen-3 oxidase